MKHTVFILKNIFFIKHPNNTIYKFYLHLLSKHHHYKMMSKNNDSLIIINYTNLETYNYE